VNVAVRSLQDKCQEIPAAIPTIEAKITDETIMPFDTNVFDAIKNPPMKAVLVASLNPGHYAVIFPLLRHR